MKPSFRKRGRSGHGVNPACVWSSWQSIWTSIGPGVLLCMIHLMSVVEVWMIAGAAKKWKCYLVHELSQRLSQPLRDYLLRFHALTDCNTTSVFSGHGKKYYWNTFRNHPLLVGEVIHDGELAPVEEFVFHLYGTAEKPTTSHAILQMLPPTRDATELHAIRANYQTEIWLYANKELIDVPPQLPDIPFFKKNI